MLKKKKAYALSAVALIAGSGIFTPLTFAESTVLESCEGIEHCAVVTSTAELDAAFDNEDTTILVGGSFDLTKDLYPDYDFTLYLNNYSIVSAGYSFVQTGVMTINSAGNGKILETTGDWAPLYIYGGLVMNGGTIDAESIAVYVSGDGVEFIMNDGEIIGGTDSVVTISVNDGAKMTMNDGVISGDTWGVTVFKDAEFEMNGGIINVSSDEGIGVAGNGSASGNNEGTNAKITLNAGTINSGDLGVYAPQINGQTVLGAGLTINAGKCGVEIRAGELTVAGATINVDANAPYDFNPNGSGSTATGVAIAVAQHTTQQPITVTVSDGVFTAPVAFAEGNPQHNPEESVEAVEISITGGDFNATNGEPVVASEDVSGFITGGSFNKEVDSDYVAAGHVDAFDYDDGSFKVVDPNNMEDPNEEVDSHIDDETGEEVHYIAPINVDYANAWLEDYTDEEGHLPVVVEFGEQEFMADRKASLSAVLVDDSGLTLTGDGELIGAFDLSMLDRNGQVIEVSDNDLLVLIELDEETYNELAAYDKLYVVYFNEDGVEEERYEAVLEVEEHEDHVWYWLWFNTPHLSTYGIVGVNEEEAAAPDTGTITASGASASVAAIVTAVIVGLLASITSFAYLIRKH